MGLMDNMFGFLFGDGAQKTIEIFKENAERAAQRAHDTRQDTLQQFRSEFAHERRGWFGQTVDGLNRLPRPIMAFGVIALFVSAMSDPLWFAARMQGLSAVPEPLWWLFGAIISFYFGARHQAKGQQFQKELLQSLEIIPHVTRNIAEIEKLGLAQNKSLKDADGASSDCNAALEAWRGQ